MRRILIVLLAALGCAVSLADGKVFRSAAVAGPITTPDQRALLYFSNGVERLVIETSIVGAGTDFAWVVPFPSEPKIEAVSTNFFVDLDRAFQPAIIFESSSAWMFLGLLWAMISVGIWAHRQKMPFVRSLLLLGIFLVVLGIVVLPSFVRSRSARQPLGSASVEILSRATIGVFDTVTLKSADGALLVDWLNRYGFFTPSNALPAISSYATQGWVFAAARLHRDRTNDPLTRPHPLGFTFKAQQPVYPLRLTGIENGACSIELFVFGEGRAQANGFKADFCGAPRVYEQFYWRNNLPGDVVRPLPAFSIGADELRRWALPAMVATKLTATLSPAQMETDASIKWAEFRSIIPMVYSPRAAGTRALGTFVGLAALGGLALQMAGSKIEPATRQILRRLATAVPILVALGWFLWADVRPVNVTRLSWPATANELVYFQSALEAFALERKSAQPLTFEELQRELPSYFKGQPSLKNLFTLAPLRQEATPGNITLNQQSNTTEIIWYDLSGGAHSLETYTNTPVRH